MNADAKKMTALFAVAGTAHMVRPAPFDAIVPPQLGNPRFWTYASGVAELDCAALIANPGTRRIGGAAAAALMVAVTGVSGVGAAGAGGGGGSAGGR